MSFQSSAFNFSVADESECLVLYHYFHLQDRESTSSKVSKGNDIIGQEEEKEREEGKDEALINDFIFSLICMKKKRKNFILVTETIIETFIYEKEHSISLYTFF